MSRYLGPNSRFGDGDGSFWDRWLTTTGHFVNGGGGYAAAEMPSRSMYAKGAVSRTLSLLKSFITASMPTSSRSPACSRRHDSEWNGKKPWLGLCAGMHLRDRAHKPICSTIFCVVSLKQETTVTQERACVTPELMEG